MSAPVGELTTKGPLCEQWREDEDPFDYFLDIQSHLLDQHCPNPNRTAGDKGGNEVKPGHLVSATLHSTELAPEDAREWHHALVGALIDAA